MRQAVAELLVDALLPEPARLVDVAVRRNHQIAIGIVGTRCALPAVMAGRLETPAILLIDLLIGLVDHFTSPFEPESSAFRNRRGLFKNAKPLF
jgi:hypothetical protein